MKKIAVLVSGGGTNLQALIDEKKRGGIKNGEITCVISSNPNAYALQRAKAAGIKGITINRKEFSSPTLFDEAIADVLNAENVDLIVLAGFMYILGEKFTKAYENRIINVHPSLIPSFCGEGFYGLNVHKAVLDYGVKLTGATVHFVNEKADAGPIILQKSVEVKQDDTPEILQKRVMEQAEWKILPKAVSLFCDDRLSVVKNKVFVKEDEN